MLRTDKRADEADLLRVLSGSGPLTRAELVQRMSWTRSMLAQRLDGLLGSGLVVANADTDSTGGRPPERLSFNRSVGVVLSGCLGPRRSDVAILDLGGDILAADSAAADLTAGPIVTLEWLSARFDALLEGAGRRPEEIWGVGIGLPGPVEFATARPIGSSALSGWDGFAVGDWLSARYGRPVFVDNDANMMAVGAKVSAFGDVAHLLFVTADTHVGAGLIVDGELHRGTNDLAGNIGHIYVPGHDDVVCQCGSTGCLEAVAGGPAVAARLTREGLPTADASDVAAHVRAGDSRATHALRDAGRDLGHGLAGLINTFNPAVLVVGGALAGAGGHLMTGVREIVYGRSPPLATHALRILAAGDDLQGVIGAAAMTTASVLAAASAPTALRQAS